MIDLNNLEEILEDNQEIDLYSLLEEDLPEVEEDDSWFDELFE